jgi:hypothetical protein
MMPESGMIKTASLSSDGSRSAFPGVTIVTIVTLVTHQLMDIALNYAKQYYKKCYLETLPNMIAAQKFYEKHGFIRIYEPVIKTDHFACDVLYIKDL